MNEEDKQKKTDNLFLDAIKKGILKAVKYYLEQAPIKANIHCQTTKDDIDYCLLVATKYNRLDVLKYFLEETELEVHTKIAAMEDCWNAPIFHTLTKMYKIAAINGDMEFIKYLITKLPKDNNEDMFRAAAIKDKPHVLHALIKEGVVDFDDTYETEMYRLETLKEAYVCNAKKSVKYIHEIYGTHHFNTSMRGTNFKIEVINRITLATKESTTDFEFLQTLMNDKDVQEIQNIQEGQKYLYSATKEIFSNLAKSENHNAIKIAMESIKDDDFKRKMIDHVLLDPKFDTTRDLGNYPFFNYVYENCPQCLSENVLNGLFYTSLRSKNPKRFNDLYKYKKLFKQANPSKIIDMTMNLTWSGTFMDDIKNVLNYEFSKEINIHDNDNFYFKKIADEVVAAAPLVAIDLIKFTMETLPDTDNSQVLSLFKEEDPKQKVVIDFLNNFILNKKLKEILPASNTSIPKAKI